MFWCLCCKLWTYAAVGTSFFAINVSKNYFESHDVISFRVILWNRFYEISSVSLLVFPFVQFFSSPARRSFPVFCSSSRLIWKLAELDFFKTYLIWSKFFCFFLMVYFFSLNVFFFFLAKIFFLRFWGYNGPKWAWKEFSNVKKN